jgi:hypothetical protein
MSTSDAPTSSSLQLEQALKETTEQINHTKTELAATESKKEELENLFFVLTDVQRYVSSLISSRKIKRSAAIPETCLSLISYLSDLQLLLESDNFSISLQYASAIISSQVKLCSQDKVLILKNKATFIDESIKDIQNKTIKLKKLINELQNNLTVLNGALAEIQNQILLQNSKTTSATPLTREISTEHTTTIKLTETTSTGINTEISSAST